MEVSCRLLTSNEEPCDWKGPTEELLPHCKAAHKYSISVSYGGLAWKYKKIFSPTVNLMWDNLEHFWCHHCDRDGIMYWTACHIESSENAPQYSYEIECYMTGNPAKKMILREVCISHKTDLERIFLARRCVAIPYEALQLYFGHNGSDILDQICFTATIFRT